MGEGIHYVGTRYEELYDLLEDWGYEVIPDPASLSGRRSCTPAL